MAFGFKSVGRQPVTQRRALAAAGLCVAFACVAGCASDKPHDYGQQRPDVYDLDSRDRGLQSRDVNMAADQMAADLLGDASLNQSREQWTLVVDRMDDKTADRRARTDFDIFLQALRARLGKQGRGRVQLIMNREKFHDIRGRELEGGAGGGDPFGQTGGGGGAAAPAAVNPDYALTGVARDMPRRGTNYYQIDFTIVNLRNRTEVWTGMYPVKVER